MKEIIVKTNDEGKRIDKFIFKLYSDLKKHEVYKLFRTKKIKLNGEPTKINYKLQINDKIQVYFCCDIKKKILANTIWMKSNPKLNIIYEDKNIIVIDKPIGLSVYDEKQLEVDTLTNRIINYLYLKKEYDPNQENSFKPALIHRIDTNTCGLVMAAKNMHTLVYFNELFRNKEIKKTYLALLYGVLKNSSGTIECFIKKTGLNIVDAKFEKPNETYKNAITKYKLLEIIKNKYSLVEIDLITGRTHQIRASFNLINHPLVGEQKYIKKNIDKNPNFKYQCLCSYKIKLPYIKDEQLNYLSNKEFCVKDIWFYKNI